MDGNFSFAVRGDERQKIFGEKQDTTELEGILSPFPSPAPHCSPPPRTSLLPPPSRFSPYLRIITSDMLTLLPCLLCYLVRQHPLMFDCKQKAMVGGRKLKFATPSGEKGKINEIHVQMYQFFLDDFNRGVRPLFLPTHPLISPFLLMPQNYNKYSSVRTIPYVTRCIDICSTLGQHLCYFFAILGPCCNVQRCLFGLK